MSETYSSSMAASHLLASIIVENNIIRGEIAHSKTRDHTSM
jgi:hypothetical protein